MRQNAIIAIILIVLGAFILTYHGYTYTTREKVLDIGPIKAEQDKKHDVFIPPLLGGLAVVGGIALLIYGNRS